MVEIKVAGYKINIQKSIAFVHTNDEASEKGNHSIHSSIKTIKYLRIDLTKEMKDLYNKNYKTLLKEIKEDTSKWKDRYPVFSDRKS